MDEVIEMQHRSEFGNVEVEAFIHGSHVLADVTSSAEIDLATLRNLVQSSIASVTDQLAFLLGNHVNVEIFAAITPTGYKHVFGVEFDYIRDKLTTEEAFGEWLPKILTVYRTRAGPYLQRCLTDYRMAMEHPEDTGFYCFRAVESLRQVFKEDEVDNGDSWSSLREATGVSRSTIEKKIQNYSNARRHGDLFTITSEERKLVLESTWEIIREFIEYASEKMDELGSPNGNSGS